MTAAECSAADAAGMRSPPVSSAHCSLCAFLHDIRYPIEIYYLALPELLLHHFYWNLIPIAEEIFVVNTISIQQLCKTSWVRTQSVHIQVGCSSGSCSLSMLLPLVLDHRHYNYYPLRLIQIVRCKLHHTMLWIDYHDKIFFE